jgi:hypothetical protein
MTRIALLLAALAVLAQTTLVAACSQHHPKTTTCTSTTNVAGVTRTMCRAEWTIKPCKPVGGISEMTL